MPQELLSTDPQAGQLLSADPAAGQVTEPSASAPPSIKAPGSGLGSMASAFATGVGRGVIGKPDPTFQPVTLGEAIKDPKALLRGVSPEQLGEMVGGAGSIFSASKIVPSVQRIMDARTLAASRAMAAKTTGDLIMAVPPSKSTPYSPQDLQTAAPYLASEHLNSPITSVETFRDAADSAITQIEEHVQRYVQANPHDLIRTKPLEAVKQALSQSPRGDFLTLGLKELSDLGLDKDITTSRADALRLQLNAENRATLRKNNYDVATARAADPAFAAREAAAESLRQGLYDQLTARGIQGVADLRRDEGSLIKLRNAAEAKIYSGDKTVGASAPSSLTRRAISTGLRLTPTPAVVSDALAGLVLPSALSRDALVQRAFKNFSAPMPQYPTVPAAPQPAGLLGPGATPLGPSPDASMVQSAPAVRGLVVRDPATGRFKRTYTSEPQP